MQDGTIRIGAGDAVAEIVPHAGGIVRRWLIDRDGREHDLLWCPDGSVATVETPNRFGLWPLVPFANRAFGGLVDDGTGTRFRLPINDPERGGTIHGFGWQSAWKVDCRAADSVTLLHRRQDGPDPYRYAARQTVTVGERTLDIELAVVNEADRPLPFGLGLHPWFPCRPDTRLVMAAGAALTLRPGYRATGHGPVPAAGDFSVGQRVRRDEELVYSYVGWNGHARIETPSAGLAITLRASPELNAPLLWAPPDAPFFCLEPQTHAIGAPSEPAARASTPLKRLLPGEALTVSLTMSIDATTD